jgi:hypothetical protein
MRYNELHRSSGKEDESRIWIKTFDSHLKLLVALKIVEKREESRYKVFYKLAVSGTIPTNELKERRKFASIQTERSMNAISELYSNQKKMTEKYREKKLERELRVIIRLMEMNLFDAIWKYAENPAYSDFVIDEGAEYFRKTTREISRIVGESKETQSFFLPVINRIYMKQQERWFRYYLSRARFRELKRFLEKEGKVD